MTPPAPTRRLLLPALLLLAALPAAGEPAQSREEDQRPVIPWPKRRATAASLGVPTEISDPSGKALDKFYAALRRTEKGLGKTRVLIYGSSHVAGDGFTGLLRHRLQERFGDAGGGFVVPSRPWSWYNHRDLNISRSRPGWDAWWVSKRHARDDGLYGLAGVSFSSADAGTYGRVETARKSPFSRQVSLVDVFFWAHPDGGSVQLIVDDARRALVPTAARDPAPGFFNLRLDDGPHSVELRPAGDGPVTLFGLALERDTPGVVVDSLGINGARAAAQLQWNEKIHVSHLARRRPDLVVLAYGTNALSDDEEPLETYEANLIQVVKRIRDATPRASCLFVGPSDWPEKVTELVKIKQRKRRGRRRRHRYLRRLRGFRPRLRQAPLIATQKRVAHRQGCGYWDWQAAMGGELSMLHWYRAVPPMAKKDLVHLTFRGYQRIGQLLWDALMAGFGEVSDTPT